MDKQELQAYRNRLLAAGLPPRKVARHLREVQDHFQDLHAQRLADGSDAATARRDSRTQMGSLDELAAAMIASTPRSLLYRHPKLMAMVLPAVLYCLVGVLLVLALVWMFEEVSDQPGFSLSELPVWLVSGADALIFMQSHVLTPLLAIVLIECAVRQHLLPRYWVPGVVLLCVLGSFSSVGLTYPDPARGGEGSLYVNIGRTRPGAGDLAEYANLLRLLLNLLLCWSWARFSQARENRKARANG